MVKVTYIGGSDSVELHAMWAGFKGFAKQGETIEVPDEVAFGRVFPEGGGYGGCLDQTDQWVLEAPELEAPEVADPDVSVPDEAESSAESARPSGRKNKG